MFIKPYRILRNEEGASPGGGAVPPAPADPQAQAEVPVTMSALKELLGSLKTELVTETKNGINADLRRAGVFKKQETAPAEHPAPTPAPQKLPGAPSAAAGLSLADVEAMLERERVITSRATEHKLSDAQIRRMKSALSGVAPEVLASEADAFLNDLGLVKAPTQTAPQPAAQSTVPAPSNPQPVSDKGSPAPGGVLDWEREFAENPIGMSPAARQRMDAKYGVEKARKMRLEAARAQAERIRIVGSQG